MPDEVQQYITCNPTDLFTQAVEIYKVQLPAHLNHSFKKITTGCIWTTSDID